MQRNLIASAGTFAGSAGSREAELEEDALEYLRSVYQNPLESTYVRMKAASIAIEYERPSLKATAIVPMGQDFASKLERAIERSNGGGRLIEAKPVKMRFIPRRRV
jgi:hypothetical protein